jgi:hypothetical protein
MSVRTQFLLSLLSTVIQKLVLHGLGEAKRQSGSTEKIVPSSLFNFSKVI